LSRKAGPQREHVASNFRFFGRGDWDRKARGSPRAFLFPSLNPILRERAGLFAACLEGWANGRWVLPPSFENRPRRARLSQDAGICLHWSRTCDLLYDRMFPHRPRSPPLHGSVLSTNRSLLLSVLGAATDRRGCAYGPEFFLMRGPTRRESAFRICSSKTIQANTMSDAKSPSPLYGNLGRPPGAEAPDGTSWPAAISKSTRQPLESTRNRNRTLVPRGDLAAKLSKRPAHHGTEVSRAGEDAGGGRSQHPTHRPLQPTHPDPCIASSNAGDGRKSTNAREFRLLINIRRRARPAARAS